MKLNFTKTTLFYTFIFLFINVKLFAQMTYNWVGGTSTDFYNVNNWSNTAINFADMQAHTMVIGAGNPNNPIQSGGNASNVSYRPNYFNTTASANITINGNLIPWNSSYLNGNITLNAPASFNIRNNVFLGKEATATLQVNGGAMYSRYIFYVGNGVGGNATANVTGGTVYVGTNLEVATGTVNPIGILNINDGTVDVTGNVNIGANGSIFISGIGRLIVTGDKVAALQTHITNGKITCPAGKTLSVTFDGTRTTATIPQNPNSLLREYTSYIILNNGIVEAKIDKRTSNILSMKVNGVETIAQTGNKISAYYDFTSSKGFETIFGATFSVKEETADYIDVSFKRPYTPGSNVTPCDADIHYVLKKNDSGLYTYSILEHKASYPDFDLGSWRQVMWIANNGTDYLAEHIFVNDVKKWKMPSVADYATATPTGIAEIIKINAGVRAGKYDGKYQYSEPLIELPAYGFGSDVNNIGSWAVFGSHEYFNSGPTHHDLNAAAGIIHICMNGVHYNSKGFVIKQGEAWSKIYGPYLLYTSNKSTAELNWADAKARAAIEKAQWPYAWLTNTPQYPLANQRGNIIGNFSINDPYKPQITGANAWIGVTQLSDDSNGQWQFEEENYQYWVKTDASGNFDIKHVRPGTYTLFAFSNGVTGEFSVANITVTANNTTNLGNIVWTIPRTNGSLIWEIGVPDRTAAEYKFGDFDYSEGYVQDKFRAAFNNPIEYNVASKNWSTALPYVHSPYFKADGTVESSWKWRLNFNLPSGIPTTGNAKLTIAYASSDHAQQWIYVNNESSTPINFYPPLGGGNAFLRQSNHAKYSIQVVDIPMNKLRVGANTITLLMPSTSSYGNHIMYDYISLEGDASMTLPVELISFNAKAQNNTTILSWATSSEQNNQKFEILRSADGIHFTSIGFIDGKGNTHARSDYNFTDKNPLNGLNYYKLIQYDFNGLSSEKGIKVVNFSLYDDVKVHVYPNPVTEKINITLKDISYHQVELTLTSLTGSVVLKQSFNKNSTGNYQINFDKQLAPGNYLLQIKANDFIEVRKLFIQ